MADSVGDVLKKIAFGIELTGGNPMRARTYAGAARTLKKIPDLKAAREAGEIAKIRGIGKSMLAIVDAVIAGEPVPKLVELQEQIPPGMWELRALKGMGPKKLRRLWQELDVTSVAELEYACNENRMVELSGFGKKTQDTVLQNIATLRERAGQLRLDHADALAQEWCERLLTLGADRAEVTGDLRRRTETVGGVELLVVGDGLNAAIVGGVARWEDGVQWADIDADGGRVSVAICPGEDLWGVFSVLCTGSAEHVAALAARAGGMGAELGPDGLVVDGQEVPCFEEDELYRELGLLPTTPERRSAGVPLVEIGKAGPRLVELGDLRGALHNHTTYSDGIHSLEVMRKAAADFGLQYLGISEHSQTAAYAGGLPPEVLREQIAAIAALNADGGCVLLTGIESDILRDGSLDYDDDLLGALDVVVASVHNRYGQGPEDTTAKMVAAASNPLCHIIGHPTGRLLLGRPATEYDVAAMLDAAAARGAAVELNANPQRLDLNEHWLAESKARGVPVSISADAHSAHALEHLRYGIDIARRAGLTPDDVLNCRPIEALREWLA